MRNGAKVDVQLEAAAEREAHLRELISQLQTALTQKDEQLWEMAKLLAQNNIPTAALLQQSQQQPLDNLDEPETAMMAEEDALIRVLKQGMLTKLSKGGFTANWNRRAFALIGSSLFYAKDRGTLTSQPKIFAELVGCTVQAMSDEASGRHSNVFAIQLGGLGSSADDSNHGGGHFGSSNSLDKVQNGGPERLLLLAADTPRDKYAWIDAISRASRLPQCPLSKVAPTLSLQMYGGADEMMNNVLQARPDHEGARVSLVNGGEPPFGYQNGNHRPAGLRGLNSNGATMMHNYAVDPMQQGAGNSAWSVSVWNPDNWMKTLNDLY